jgi:hypothetical protein
MKMIIATVIMLRVLDVAEEYFYSGRHVDPVVAIFHQMLNSIV